jgi:hypothetical protein
MSRKVVFSLLFAIVSWTSLSPRSQAEIVDRIVAVVNGRIITLSDIRKEHQIQLVLGVPADTEEVILKSLIDRYLLEEEMYQYPGLNASDDEVDEDMKLVTVTHGIPPAEIRAAIVRRIQWRKYLYLRFGQFIVVTNEEIEAFYNNEFVPEAKRRGVAPQALSQVTMEIHQHIYEIKLSQELENSLKELRTRSTTTIEVFQ